MSDRLISRNTKLLRGAGQTIHEYHAGPNINITDDVISGRDWTQDIQDAVNSGVAGQLSAGDNIALNTENNITTISVTGELYSAGDNINITDRTISGKDWTQDISDQIASAISGKADASAIPEIVEYSAGDNIDISNHVISGKDWSYEIGQKADRSEVIERISAASESIVNNLTETISSTSSEIIDIISATSGQGGSGSCPWISGGTTYSGDYLEIGPGDVVPLISGWDLSGDHNHHIWLKGRYIKFPGEETFLPTSSFNNFISATFTPNINNLYSSASYVNINKLDISAFTAYSAAHSGDDNTPYSGADGIAVEDHIISITGDVGKTYSAGTNININSQNVISGKNWQPEIDAAVSGKQDTMSAGSNIYIYNNTISGKDWSSDIQSAVSGKADTTAIPEYPETKPLSAGPGIAIYDNNDSIAIACTVDPGSASIDPYIAGANINITNQVISGRNWQQEITSATSGKLDTSATTTWDKEHYIAGTNINISNHVVSGKDWTQEITSATSGKADKSEIPTVVDYSAGANINITNHVVSGKDWTETIKDIAESAVSAYDPEPYVAGDNINITDHTISGKDWTDEIAAASGIPYSAGANINITDHVVSGKDWSGEISAAVSGKQDTLSAGSHIDITNNTISVTGEMGKVYSGRAPILVDNTNDIIGLDMNANYTFIPGTNIEFVEDSDEKTVTINGTYNAAQQIQSATSGLVPYAALNTYTDEFSNNVVSSIDDLNGNPLLISAKYADYATLAASAQFDTLGRPLYQLASQNQLSAYIPFSAIDGDSATSSISAINGSACAGGDKIKYWYSTPVTSISAEGDLQITRHVASTTPEKIRVQVNSTDVGLLVPTNTGHNSMLVTNAMGSVQWADQSALIPDAYTGTTYKCLICTAEDLDEGLDNFPPTSANFTYTLINGNQTADIYYSAGGATATLNPGESVTMMWDATNQYLYATPITEVVDIFDTVACRWRDLDNMRLERVSSSAEATERGVLYVVTGSN
jgi:hypothetical protein